MTRCVPATMLTALLLLSSGDATAVRAPIGGSDHGFHTTPHVRGSRSGPTLSATPAPSAISSARYQRGWRYLWDTDTGVPARIYGEGRAFPGVIDDADRALAAAQQVLAADIDVLAPGSSVSDFVLLANVELRGTRFVSFAQHHRGVPIRDATVSFRFKADRLIVIASDAMPYPSVSDLSTPLPGFAADAATSWISRDLGVQAVATSIESAVIVPLVHGPGDISFHTALPVMVAEPGGVGEWTVFIGATELALGHVTNVHHAEGTVLYNAPERWPGAARVDYPAPLTEHTVDGVLQLSDSAGLIIFDNATAQVDTGLTGSRVRIVNQGANATTSLTVNDGASATWNDAADEMIDAQVAVFIHGNVAMVEGADIAPNLAVLAQAIPANVNRTDRDCNATANRNEMNFFVASAIDDVECGNTGRLADVIYHEFGHYFHINTIDVTGVPFDSAFSEGLSDYFAAQITADPDMGRGFFKTEAPLRPIDGPGGDIYWPQAYWDDVDTHYTGVVFAGAMWDLRLALLAEYGDEAGDAIADKLFYGAVQRASGVETTYIEVLTEDDDDGNLMNGTPNQCAIDFAFGTHGLGPSRSILGDGLEPHTRDKFTISIAEATPTSGCPAPAIGSIELFWRLRSDPETNGTLTMELADGQYAATIPTQPEGEVIEYQMTITYADGNVRRIPLNLANPFYEFFNGEVEEIYCTDFEGDVLADGWGLLNTEIGAPQGGDNNTDPPAAFSGDNVGGTFLDGNGAYPNRTTTALSPPVIDVGGRQNVRVQFQRWLNVADKRLDEAWFELNNVRVIENFEGTFDQGVSQYLDHEWKFTDVDASAAAAAGSLTMSFGLRSGGRQPDRTNRLGGWNIDDFCVVEFVPSVCGDGRTSGNEECDDGENNSDSNADACRTTCVAAICGDGATDSGEECDDGNLTDDDECSNTCIDQSSGCGCQATDSSAAGWLFAVLLVGIGFGRRRRRRRHS